MSIPVPALDDRTYAQLVEEAKSMISKHCPEWTDFHPADPGITLMELFAFLTEAVIYHMDRIPERSRLRFAELLGMDKGLTDNPELLLALASGKLKERNRAITFRDMENIIKKKYPEDILVVKAVLDTEVPFQGKFGKEHYVNIILILKKAGDDKEKEELFQNIYDDLRKQCLITTRLRVREAQKHSLGVRVSIIPALEYSDDRKGLEDRVVKRIESFFDPCFGGVKQEGWEFGRPVFRSEIYQIIEEVCGVDHVRKLTLLDIQNGSKEFKGNIELLNKTSIPVIDPLHIEVILERE
ncbi:MAG: hypothetical protein N2645_14100 [Clostridia bacterium]|nr:hypothetical protein [Clostridia bacterium]